MKNVDKAYEKVVTALTACENDDCINCPINGDECIHGDESLNMIALKMLEAMHDWMVDKQIWQYFVRDTEGSQMDPLDWSEQLHKYAEEMLKYAETSADATHPDHYNSGGMQAWDAMEAAWGAEAVQNFCVCNAMKYIWRQDRKNGREDVEKAIVYLRKWIELEEKC